MSTYQEYLKQWKIDNPDEFKTHAEAIQKIFTPMEKKKSE